MKKQSLDKTKQQFKLGERVFAVVQKDRVDRLIEGVVCGVSKRLEDENAEVRYTVKDARDGVSLCDCFFEALYDNIFKDLEAAQQKVLDAAAQNYEKTREGIASAFTALKAASEKQSVAETQP